MLEDFANTGLLIAAVATGISGMAWLSLSMESHWKQVRGRSAPLGIVKRLRALGSISLAASLALCLSVDHASIATLVWVMVLTASALAVALTLTWRPQWLRLLTWPAQRGN